MAVTWKCPSCGTVATSESTAGLVTCPGCSRQLRLAAPASNTVTVAPPVQSDSQVTQDHVRSDATPTVSLPSNPEQRTIPPQAADARAPAGYVIEKELGRGGMGVVYLARHLRLNRPCALKMILAGGHADAGQRERFETEAQAIARLQHENIVRVYEIGEHQGQPFMALEFCEGGSLDRKLRERQPTPKEAAHLVRTLAVGMQAAHDASVIHRDLKPANVLLAGDGTPKITDFGLAKKLDEDGATRTGSIMGTPSYMPPEQARGEGNLGPTVDVYALGAILYECLTGRPPFKSATPMETLRQVLDNEAVGVRQLNPAVPRDLETIVHKCLQKDPGRRYVSARELADDLGRFLAGEPIQARPVGKVERAGKWVRRNPVVSALVAAVVLVLTVGVVASWLLAGWAITEKGRADLEAELKGNEATTARKAEERATNLAKTEADAKQLAEARSAEALREKREAVRQTDIANVALERASDQLKRAELARYAGQLAQAQREYETGNVLRSLEILNDCQWDLRDTEFRYLWTRYNSNHTLRGHRGPVLCVAFSPDGKRIVSGSGNRDEGGQVKVWNTATGQELLSFNGHRQPVVFVAFLAGGKRIVSASRDATVKVWEAETGQEEKTLTLKGHHSFIDSLVFSSDGKQILTAGDTTARVWDSETGKELLSLKGYTGGLRSAAFSPDGKRILTNWDRTARVWDAATGKEIRSLEGHTGAVLRANWSPDGKRVLTGSGGYDNQGKPLPGEAKVWDAETGKEILSLKGHTASVNSVSWSSDGKRILTGSSDLSAKVWDAETGQEILTLKGHTAFLNCVSWSPDGKHVLTGSRGPGEPTTPGEVRIWAVAQDHGVRSLRGHTDPVLSVAFSPDGKRMLSGGSGSPFDPKTPGEVKLWDIEKNEEVFSLKGVFGPVAFSPDGKRFLTSNYFTAKMWDAETGKEIFSPLKAKVALTSMAFSRDGTRILIGSHDGTADVWNAKSGGHILRISGHPQRLNTANWSPDGNRIVTGSADTTVRIWDAGSGRELKMLLGHTGAVVSVVFSPDGKRILSGAFGDSAKVWDADKGTELLSLEGHTGAVYSVAYTADGKRILTGSLDTTAKIWDAEKGQLLLTIQGHSGAVNSVAVSIDGKHILTGSDDRTAKVWDTDKGQEVLVLKGATDCVAFSPDGKRLFTGGHPAKVWDAEKGQVLARSLGKRCAAFSPDSTRILTGGRDQQIATVADAETGTHLVSVRGHTHFVSSVAFSPDGKRFFTAGTEYTRPGDEGKLWDSETGVLIRSFQQATGPVAFSSDGTRILTGAPGRGWIILWDVDTGNKIRTWDGKDRWICLAFSPDGKRIVTGGSTTAKVWDTESGKEVLTLKGHDTAVVCVTFSRDGQSIRTGSSNNIVTVWNAETGKDIRSYKGPPDEVTSMVFSPDGKRVMSACKDGTTKVWEIPGK